MFNARSLFVYRIHSLDPVNNGYFIRKKQWFDICNNEKCAEIRDRMKERLEEQYE